MGGSDAPLLRLLHQKEGTKKRGRGSNKLKLAKPTNTHETDSNTGSDEAKVRQPAPDVAVGL